MPDDIKRFHRFEFVTQTSVTHDQAARIGLTLGITRRPERFIEDESRRVAGRVHAVVRRGLGMGLRHR